MAMQVFTLNKAKGYATEANLMKALERTGLNEWDLARTIIIARKPDGKWTAIFCLDYSKGGYIALASQHGFVTV